MTITSGISKRTFRFELLLLVSVVVLAFAIAMAVGIGEMRIPIRTVALSICNHLGFSAVNISQIQDSVIWNLRLSRALVAALCGAGLAICGAILQSLLRNALAEPYVLGVSAGASTGAVAIVIMGVGAGTVSLSVGAFAGAMAAFVFVAILSNSGRGGPDRTILAGVAAAQLFNALTAYIVTTSGNAQQARDVMFWLLGSFGGVRWPEFQLLIVIIIGGLTICIWHAQALDAFTFGDDAAASLGIHIGRVRFILFSVTALITATIVSMVGAIGFVGLVVPHAVRFLIGPGHMRLLPACALVGAVFMVLADIVSRSVMAQQTLPIGIVTALVGVPCFSLILYRARQAV